ncbi:MAG: ornithine cyclodeaminase [Pseudomonadota bacterium]
MPTWIGYDDAVGALNWAGAVEAVRAGHVLKKAELGDVFLGGGDATWLTRAARIDGLGAGVKSVSVFPQNPEQGLPTVQGGMFFFEPVHGALEAIIDSKLVTDFKTAADSVLGACLLARTSSKRLLIVGAGVVASNLARAYPEVMRDIEHVGVWARRPEQAEALVAALPDTDLSVSVVRDLEPAVGDADIVASATGSSTPVIKGEWVQPGTHVDLIGAFRKDMREADDALIAKARIFVDSRETTIGHIGELTIPMDAGIISKADVLGDFYELLAGDCTGRMDPDDITVFKNGGGAHLDVMIARYILDAVADRDGRE